MSIINHKPHKAIYGNEKTSVKIFKNSLHFYILENKARMVKAEDLSIVFEPFGLLNQEVLIKLNPVIATSLLEPILVNVEGSFIYCYEAGLIPDLCNDILLNKHLPNSFRELGRILYDSLLKTGIGIYPLVDEVVGYKPKHGEYAELFNKAYKEATNRIRG